MSRSIEREPLVIIVSAPSGSGKTTIINHLLEKMPGVKRSVSYTTRPPREGEKQEEDYIFLSREEFEKRIEKGELLEWEENFGHYYGTSKAQLDEAIEKKEDLILSIDVKGARKVREKIPESISIFVMPPSVEELRSRLEGRNTDQETDVSQRLKESEREIASSDEYDYVIVNEEIEKAVDELYSIIEKERQNRQKMRKR